MVTVKVTATKTETEEPAEPQEFLVYKNFIYH